MLSASFLDLTRQKPDACFRGKGVRFWIQSFFSELDFIEPKKKISSINPLILFDASKFSTIEFNDLWKLLDDISSQDKVGEDGIFSIPGYPFYIISCKSKKSAPYPPFEKLKKDAVLLSISADHTIWDVKKDIFKIEEYIAQMQYLKFRERGVGIEDLRHFYIEGLPEIGKGTILASGTVIKGATVIGKNVMVYPHVYIEDSIIGDGCKILPGCVLRDSRLEESTQIGPYAHLRNGSVVRKGAKVGNFVEMKKSELGEASKAMHLTYLGDAKIGKNVNIGAGTITCNFDGLKKNRTIMEDDVFVGSGTQLIAPIIIGEGSYIGAGSTINRDVPPSSLAIARQKQRNIKGWGYRRKKK